MDERNLKDLLYQEFARIGKCLSSPKRLEILDILSQGPKSVEALAKNTDMSVANVSQHLKVLFNARLVIFEKEGNFVFYELANEIIADFLTTFHALSENQLSQVQQIREEFLNNQLGLDGITLTDLASRMDKGEVLLLDVRPKEEYEKAHIPGAVSIPIAELEAHLASLPTNCDVVAYCRGPYCLMSAEAVKILKASGINAFRLEEGFRKWQQLAK
ncbi:ArsR/SmtB family transcription factor [Lysinibacillus pakistanensis]|uniref:Metalloregulator ArsR/SmtB family transcription factor n=1 Tax=Lysinibacillus pakistanensis TaxID=759811 RepID=A0AAX3X480_9BACI|nr:metalloregulator ArsR/SmtB family transcription factor [Lysinibacillus pakistanensis]MDM5233994.1 metalloregulator ArsR/SmtB family transcription factor [Lysinibacillus pakistanensis]WHY49184.1 metalloregulator ArsR/SmtB family transcription factor [Lysinibacillus pakistanensis]WHY54192.1 metalloregulator ArsR/SmtB family transcription factor [Lysinibacillus pakistanensis]